MKKVLVAGNHLNLKSALSKFLVNMGIEPIEVSSIDETNRNDIDLIIADTQASKNLVETHTPIVIITPFIKANKKNVVYMNQPFDINELHNVIEKFIGSTCVTHVL